MGTNAPYTADHPTYGRVLVVVEWGEMRGGLPCAVIEYGEPEQRGDDVYARRATVPLSELTKIESERK